MTRRLTPPRLPKWTAWFHRRNSAGCLGAGVTDGKHLWMLKLSRLFWDDHPERAKNSRENCCSSWFSWSFSWRVRNSQNFGESSRFPAWIIAVVMLAVYSWNPVPRLHGLFTGQALENMRFPRISGLNMFQTWVFQCFLWPLHVGWIHPVLDIPGSRWLQRGRFYSQAEREAC